MGCDGRWRMELRKKVNNSYGKGGIGKGIVENILELSLERNGQFCSSRRAVETVAAVSVIILRARR